ncbi:MAG: FeoA family protein [Ruthenibacterium lactatiformans]
MTLDKLPVGQTRRIAAVGGQGALRRRLLDMGLTPKTQVTVQKVAPMGDPIELRLRGYELTLRLDDAREIALEAPDGRRNNGICTRRQPELRQNDAV